MTIEALLMLLLIVLTLLGANLALWLRLRATARRRGSRGDFP